ncbi:membrane-spanning 4-domains subfamily A member 4A [Neoarius graeffei]|uniref:membrane-spanning 4-domains subfamily A member 4A n=1 Tax=Neoarius graeffei TaxID=443677 RepID=UPI00298CC3B4|nr:membrane-spanning 4-domains subfamily A member 4A [Neoarius graeffei]
MASSVTTDAHGVRVVTQIIPMVTPEPAQIPSDNKDKTKVPDVPYMTRMFLKGEPVALGIVQILIGIIMMPLGAVTWFTQTLYGEIPLSLGLSFIFSGAVTLGAHKGTHLPLIKSTIAMNIISALLAVSGICYFCFALTIQLKLNECIKQDDDYWYNYYDCISKGYWLKDSVLGIKVMLLVLSVLEVCVCTTTIVFSCKANIQASGTTMAETVTVMEKEKYSSQEALLKREVASPSCYEP